MQIILIQSEIEEAIIDYVNSQFEIKEGQSIDIDLRATRGADGFQAFIEIRKAGSNAARSTAPVAEPAAVAPVVAAQEEVAAPVPEAPAAEEAAPAAPVVPKSKPLGIEKAVRGTKAKLDLSQAKTTTVLVPEPEAEPEVEAPAEAAVELEVEPAAEVAEEEAPADPNEALDPVYAEPAIQVQSGVKSIFGNTKAPVAAEPASVDAAAANEDEVPAEKPKSIFGGLRKPVNS